MSHFTVLVIGKNPEEQLAPFQENNMGDCPQEFMKYKVYDTEGQRHWFDSEEDFLKSGIKTDEDETGYWENPNAKWDWYQLGGRWTGFFKVKETATFAAVGSPAEEGTADQLFKSDIDFEAMRKEAADRAAKTYDTAMAIIGHLPENRTWKSISNEFGYADQARNEYWSQERCIAWKEEQKRDYQNFPFSFRASPDDFLINKEQYVQNAMDSAITTHAIIKDGKWYERGQMGWWATISNDKGDNWNKEFSELLNSLPEDTLLSVYDCHI